MLAWVDKFERSAPQDLPSRNIRPWLSNGLIIDFLLYGVVYMSSMLGLIDAHTERKGFFVLTFGSKIAYCAAFVFIRADEYHKTLTDVLRKVSVSNVGLYTANQKAFPVFWVIRVELDNNSPNSFSYRGSYFSYRGEGAGCRLMCAWVRVGRFLSVLGEGLAPRFVKEC